MLDEHTMLTDDPNSPVLLALRRALRRDGAVVDALNAWWGAACNTWGLSEGEGAILDKELYVALWMRL